MQFLFAEEPADIGYANTKLVLTVVCPLAKHLAGAYLACRVVGFDHQVGQGLPVQAEVPFAHLAAGIHHIHTLALLLRVIIFILCKGIDDRGQLIVEHEKKETRVYAGEVSVRGIYGYV